MKKTITALLLSLVTVLCLTAVAWATLPNPPAPTEAELLALTDVVKVSCTAGKDPANPAQSTRHGSKSYQLIPGTYTTKDYEGNDCKVEPYGTDGDGAPVWRYIFWLTEDGEKAYISKFEEETKSSHAGISPRTGIILVYKNTEPSWQLDPVDGAAEIDLYDCNTIPKPDAPSPDLIKTGQVFVVCESNHQQHSVLDFTLIPGTYYTDATSMRWNNSLGAWLYNVYLRQGNEGISPYVNPFFQANGKHLVNYVSGELSFIYRSNENKWEILGDGEYYSVAYIWVCDFPTAAELGLNVNVKCTGSGKHADKKYDTANLLADTSLSFEPVLIPYSSMEPYYVEYHYKVFLTDTAANGYAANYGTAVGKTHTWDKVKDYVTMCWSGNQSSNYSIDPANHPSAGIAVYSDPTEHPVETPPSDKWMLVRGSKDTLTVNTTDTTTPGGTGGGFPFKDSNKTTTPTVSSAKTFDAGTAMYAGLAILSLTGSAMVIRKKEF